MCKTKVLGYLFVFVLAVVAMFVGKVLFETIYYSDMPEWLKYILLH